IYLRDRLNTNTKGRCDRPSPQQLQRIQLYFNRLLEQAQDGQGMGLNRIALSDTNVTLHRLQSLAQSLREYRIHVRRKTLPGQSLDAPESAQFSNRMTTSEMEEGDNHEVEDFLRNYRQLFLACLDEAIATVINRKVQKLGKNKAKEKRGERFLTAIQLYCQGQTMAKIAPQIGYERQDQVTYLLKLKDLRTDIRHEMLSLLSDRVQTLAQQFRDPNQLHALDIQIDSALGEQVAELMDKATREATEARNGPLKSLLYQRISVCLKRWSKVPA
ncbi:MAG: hypothetical protein F6K35_37530, partial [Okeania sp. SIO2H7]|nr:hypothetical protein [Okeania sp. SIO2H7]